MTGLDLAGLAIGATYVLLNRYELSAAVLDHIETRLWPEVTTLHSV